MKILLDSCRSEIIQLNPLTDNQNAFHNCTPMASLSAAYIPLQSVPSLALPDDSEHITVGKTEVQTEDIWIQPHNCFTKITSQIFCLRLKVTTKCFMLERFVFFKSAEL